VELASITDQTVVNRKTAIGGGLVALTALVLPGQVRAQAKTQPDDSFVVLLKGLYQPVTQGPNLGLSMVDLNDGSYSTTRIYPVNGTPGSGNPSKPVGDFYVQFNGDLCAYHIPGGSFSMRFTGSNADFVDDGQGGRFLEGTFELTILEGTGIYKPFVGGHNHMVDKLHFLAPGDGSGGVDEYCFCFISRQ
jgi:hypothetical protein